MAAHTFVAASGSSRAVRDYEDKLKAIELRRIGLEKSAVASKLGRGESWVQKWWRQQPELLQRPHGAQDQVFQRTPLAGFRDLEITRGVARDSSLFEVLANSVTWRQGKVMMRDPETGELVLRFDRSGATIPAKRKVADCPKGIPALESLLRRVFAKANIHDTQARVVLNFYEDGSKTLNAHRHDFWTCLVSLGAPRMLEVDHKPYLLEDGDMILFGTQMHGVPAMPDVAEGRISIVVFFHPDRDNLSRRWLTLQSAEADDQDKLEEAKSAATFDEHGSTISGAALGGGTLAALRAALDSDADRNRPRWRKSNAELQFLEYPRLPKTTVFSVGCGSMGEADFMAGLIRHSIEWLWDLRDLEHVGACISDGTCASHFYPQSLREAVRGRVKYRHWPLGTAAAGGLTKHLFETEEGVTLVNRLALEAHGSMTCFLGICPDVQNDRLRQSVSSALLAAGADVVHLYFNERWAGIPVSQERHECVAADCILPEYPLHSSGKALVAMRPCGRSLTGHASDTGAELSESTASLCERACNEETLSNAHSDTVSKELSGSGSRQPVQDSCASPIDGSSVSAPRGRWSRRTHAKSQ